MELITKKETHGFEKRKVPQRKRNLPRQNNPTKIRFNPRWRSLRVIRVPKKDTRADEKDTSADGKDTRADGKDTRADGKDTRADGKDMRAEGKDTRADEKDTIVHKPN